MGEPQILQGIFVLRKFLRSLQFSCLIETCTYGSFRPRLYAGVIIESSTRKLLGRIYLLSGSRFNIRR